MRNARGVTLIELLVVFGIIALLVSFLMPAVSASREAARRAQCVNNLKQLGLAAVSYESVHGVFPYGVGGGAPPGEDRVPRWSAHSQLLPFLEQSAVFSALNFSGVAWLSDPVYGPPNATAIRTKIGIFVCPSDSDAADPYGLGHNSYRGNAGTLPYNLAADSPDGTGRNNGIFWYQSAVKTAMIIDGTSTSAFFSERCLGSRVFRDPKVDYYLGGVNRNSCGNAAKGSSRYGISHELSGQRWGDGALFYTRYNHVFPPNSPSCLLGCTTDYECPVVVSASSRHPGGVHMALVDGSVRFFMDQVAPRVWQGLGTIAGNEVVSGDGN